MCDEWTLGTINLLNADRIQEQKNLGCISGTAMSKSYQ